MCLATVHAGVLITRTPQGLQFTDAFSIVVNGKDKANSLGGAPSASGPANKLPSVHIAGSLLNNADSNVIAHYESGKIDFLIPQGLPKGAPTDPAGMWKASHVVFKKSQQDKAGTEVAAGTFVAYLAEGVEELTTVCMDADALEFIGGKGKSFPTQIELMSAVVKEYKANAAIAPLEQYVAGAMRSRYEKFETGTTGVDVLMEGLKFVELSQAVYPASAEQDKLRRQLVERKAWLERRQAILNAFAAGGQWDALLLSDREVEKYHKAFPPMGQLYASALSKSFETHRAAGERHTKDEDYKAAVREFDLASYRKPSDDSIRDERKVAWGNYTRAEARKRADQLGKLSPGSSDLVDEKLRAAERSMQGGNLADALKNVKEAEDHLRKALPPGVTTEKVLPVLRQKAEILGKLHLTSEAMKVLDEYDLNAADEEKRNASKTLRTDLAEELKEKLAAGRRDMQSAWSAGNFNTVWKIASQGLKMKDDDADSLFYGGQAAIILRDRKNGIDLLNKYLTVTNTLDAKQDQRERARNLLASHASPVLKQTQGEPNWMSGLRLPDDVFYCPVSLAFQPRLDHVDANNFKLGFEWSGAKLKSITPTFLKADHATGEKRIQFVYDDRGPQVAWASDSTDVPPAIPTDPDAAYHQSLPLLLNHPVVDPVAIQQLTGKSVAVGIAGNRFFNPLVWEKLYYFRFTYDDQGRVAQAQELSGPGGSPGEQILEFTWSGLQLQSIQGYQGKVKNYERTMQYQDGKLVTETVLTGSKTSLIKYSYQGGRVVLAEAATDPSLDNRSRKVTFHATR